ncbi:hypothetical protein C7974DRAFT_379436 [Boeremia exigua]|uniref:uncharacterized protein n=1 Tax=Boeremia exigua TaxID=749465 RepID=UPI001E8E7ED0|nr:uncharacterized protein C7974DRAFT_379436 [Boeremia exigua]KAH6616547.1 hypothetical protein C7974DRAFT_379436 [Boeremia exigua]
MYFVAKSSAEARSLHLSYVGDEGATQPPAGAMSYDEFIRSSSRDSEMRTLETMINHMLAAEMRLQETRETMFREICAGRKDLWEGCNDIINNESTASCQRVGFLLGHATAFRMDSEILTRAHAFFEGSNHVTSAAAVATSTRRQANSDTARTTTDDANQPNGVITLNGGLTNGHSLANGVHSPNGGMTNGHGLANGELSIGDPALAMSPSGDSFMPPL